MKKTITTLQEALAYQLRGLVYAETKVGDEFEICSQPPTSPELRVEIQRYIGNADNELQKLNRDLHLPDAGTTITEGRSSCPDDGGDASPPGSHLFGSSQGYPHALILCMHAPEITPLK